MVQTSNSFYLRTRLESNRVAIKKVLQRVSKRIENRWGLTQLYNRLEFKKRKNVLTKNWRSFILSRLNFSRTIRRNDD